MGAFGETQIRAFAGIPGVEVTAVASRSLARANEVAAAYNIQHAYGSYEELIVDPRVDSVSICTEESAHVAPAVQALAVGKHVFVEKPLATTRQDAMTLYRAAQSSAGCLMPGHIMRFEPRIASLKAMVDRGKMGSVAAIHASRNRPRTTLQTYGRCHPAMVTALHDLDIIMWIMDELPSYVQAWQRLDRGPNGVYGVWATLHFPSGSLATIEATWMVPADAGSGISDRFSLVGTMGMANIEFANSGMQVLEAGRSLSPELSYDPALHGKVAGALQNELLHFVRLALGEDRVSIVSPADGVRAIILAESIIAAATRNEKVAIDWSGI
jgi:predicted dehydrogenase